MKTIYTLALLLIFTILSAQTVKDSTIQHQFELTGDIISFPLTLVNAYPFISGEVNGVIGKLMFDTGNQKDLELNNNIIPLPSQKWLGNGQVGSGQRFKTYINDTIKDVRLVNGLHYQNLQGITSGNFDFLQKNITPDCIGYIGHNFFRGYLFKLDYTRRMLTFYKNSPQRDSSKDFLAGEKVIAILDFEIRNLPNHPIIKVKVGDVELLASFDTGGYGNLDITESATEKLKQQKYLIDYGKDSYNAELFALKQVKINPKLITNLNGLNKLKLNSYVRNAIGITEENYVLLAYRFFVQYKTVWDYDHKKIYILAY